jgi:hypothetical protein
MPFLSATRSCCPGLGLLLLLVLSGCSRPQMDPWPLQLNSAAVGQMADISVSQRAEFEAGFTNGASMVHEALKAGLRPYRPMLSVDTQPPRWRGTVPEGMPIELFRPSVEVDPNSGLLMHPASGAKSSAFARGQVSGFDWALAAIGQSLVHPPLEPGFPKRWAPWETLPQGAKLNLGQRTVRVIWAPGHLAWTWTERGFPGRRNWRPWDDSEAPAWVGLSDHALWVESKGGQAIALDLESGGILCVKIALPHELPKRSDWESYQKTVIEEYQSPGFQQRLNVFRKAADSGEIQSLLALAEHLSGMGIEADHEAFTWYLKAAEKGSPEAMLRVGVALFHGQTTQVDKVGAGLWLDRAIQAGHPNASAVKEMLFHNGN